MTNEKVYPIHSFGCMSDNFVDSLSEILTEKITKDSVMKDSSKLGGRPKSSKNKENLVKQLKIA